MFLEAAVAADDGGVVEDDNGSEALAAVFNGFRVTRLDLCPTLMHVKVDVGDDRVYSLRHLVTGATVALEVGKEFEARRFWGTWAIDSTWERRWRPIESSLRAAVAVQ